MFVWVWVVAVSAVLTTPAFAKMSDSRVGETSVGIRGGILIPEEDDTDNSFELMGDVSYQFTEYLRGQIEFGWAPVDEDILGTAHIFPILFNGQVTIPTGTDFTPYLTGGVGVLFVAFDESDLLESSAAEIETDPAFAVKLGGGFDYRFNPNVSFSVDGGFVFSESEAELKLNGATIAADDVSLDHWLVNGGFRVYF